MAGAEKPTRLPYLFAKKHQVIAVDVGDGLIHLYHQSAIDWLIVAEVERFMQGNVTAIEVSSSEFQQHLAQVYQSQSSVLDAAIGMEGDFDLMKLAGELPVGEDLLDTQDEAPIIRLLNALFTQAIKQKASDIHIETYENRVIVRMPDEPLHIMHQMIAEPHGIILMTGPTGSGKTTSLYAMLTELNQVSRNILTIEDPIEYDLPGIGQTQVNSKVHMTFAKGLRAILRQDPDVVMIGEIRDLETAEIAVQASLTGHLVLSTLHTNSALGALTRLHDMGIESFLLSSSIVGLIAQRLVRKLCAACKTPYTLSTTERKLLGVTAKTVHTVFAPTGCDACHHTGYSGRTGIYELIAMDEHLRELIHHNRSLTELESYLRPRVPTIREDGFKRVLAGVTSLAEVLRVTSG